MSPLELTMAILLMVIIILLLGYALYCFLHLVLAIMDARRDKALKEFEQRRKK